MILEIKFIFCNEMHNIFFFKMLRKHFDKHSLERDGLLTQRELERYARNLTLLFCVVLFISVDS